MSHATSSDSLRVEGVTLRYPRAMYPALEDVSIGLAKGSLCALVGPNGAGKSTLMKEIQSLCLNVEAQWHVGDDGSKLDALGPWE